MSYNKLTLLVLLSLLLVGQTSKFPDIGDIIYYSKKEYNALITGCTLTYDKAKKELICKDVLEWIEIYPNTTGSNCIENDVCEPVEIGCDPSGLNSVFMFRPTPYRNVYATMWLTLPEYEHDVIYEINKIKFNYHGSDYLPNTSDDPPYITMGLGWHVFTEGSLWTQSEIDPYTQLILDQSQGVLISTMGEDVDYEIAANPTDRFVIIFSRINYAKDETVNLFDTYEGTVYVDSVEIGYRKVYQ